MADERLKNGVLAGLILALSLVGGQARAELGSLGALTVELSVGAGFQTDSRPCDTAGTNRSVPGTATCILWGGGVDASLLWRGHIGAALGLWSIAGQAAVIPDGGSGAAFPDRVSVPLLVDFRPFSFVLPSSQNGYLSRFLYGLRLAVGPSLEIVRTSSDSSLAAGDRTGSVAASLVGANLFISGEVPLTSSPSGLALRFSTRLLYAPIVVLNDGLVQSAPIVSTDSTPATLTTTFQGYTTHVQVYLGLAYYF